MLAVSLLGRLYTCTITKICTTFLTSSIELQKGVNRLVKLYYSAVFFCYSIFEGTTFYAIFVCIFWSVIYWLVFDNFVLFFGTFLNTIEYGICTSKYGICTSEYGICMSEYGICTSEYGIFISKLDLFFDKVLFIFLYNVT